MFSKPRVPDRQIREKLTGALPRRGIRPPCDIRVSVVDGTVTLSGKVESELQRKAAIHAATCVNGVQRVIDNMSVMYHTIGGWRGPSETFNSATLFPHQAGDHQPLTFLLDPGEANPEEIADLLCEMSTLYEMMGGRGIQFTVTDCREPVEDLV